MKEIPVPTVSRVSLATETIDVTAIPILELSTTYNVTINSNQVLIGSNPNDLSNSLQSLTGKKEVHTLGYEKDPTLTVSQTAPLPMRVLGITSEVYY